MKAFLDAYLPERPGEIVLGDGRVVGQHDGIEHFTIGQRKGLGVAWSEPLHVVRLDAAMNRVVVAPRAEAARRDAVVGAINWVSIDPPSSPLEVQVQVRYRSAPERARLIPVAAAQSDQLADRPHRCRLEFLEPQFSITPAQAAVFYDGEMVLELYPKEENKQKKDITILSAEVVDAKDERPALADLLPHLARKPELCR